MEYIYNVCISIFRMLAVAMYLPHTSERLVSCTGCSDLGRSLLRSMLENDIFSELSMESKSGGLTLQFIDIDSNEASMYIPVVSGPSIISMNYNVVESALKNGIKYTGREINMLIRKELSYHNKILSGDIVRTCSGRTYARALNNKFVFIKGAV